MDPKVVYDLLLPANHLWVKREWNIITSYHFVLYIMVQELETSHLPEDNFLLIEILIRLNSNRIGINSKIQIHKIQWFIIGLVSLVYTIFQGLKYHWIRQRMVYARRIPGSVSGSERSEEKRRNICQRRVKKYSSSFSILV